MQDVYFGTPHSRSGCLYQVSTMTVNGSMKLTFHPASPIVSEETNSKFADAFVDLLEKVANTKSVEASAGSFNIPEGSLSTAAAALGAVGIAIHAGAWSEFFSNLATMKENVQVRLVVEHCYYRNILSYHILAIFFYLIESSRFLGRVQLLDFLCCWSSHIATNSVD